MKCFTLIYVVFLFLGIALTTAAQNQSFDGFQNAQWGMAPAQVQAAVSATGWRQSQPEQPFPEGADIAVYESGQQIAGYPASTKYYFWKGQLFQATVTFNFDDLKSYDFNYNVFRSVDEYYRVIHDRTLTFVHDIYELLRKKYGKKRPVFKGLDPRFIFKRTDAFLKQERWNLRYAPYEYYKNIVTASYARWDYPKTRVLFSVNISAADKRFDYLLSASSIALQDSIKTATDSIRMQGL